MCPFAHHPLTRSMEAPRPRAFEVPSTCADATQNTITYGGITLKKLPATGTYKIRVTATTILKQKLTGSQSYKACGKGSGKIGLKGGKKKH
jgi:hypothetical protein